MGPKMNGNILQYFWSFLTFGERFPSPRIGESWALVITRSFFVCLIKIICWGFVFLTIVEWGNYLHLGNSRPYIATEAESILSNGTPVPLLSLSSTEPNKFRNFTQGYFYDLNGPQPLGYQGKRSNNSTSDEMDLTVNVTTLRSELLEYIEIQIDHTEQPPVCGWYKLSLRHPDSTGQAAAYKDRSNVYFYKPGYIVEIRYRPLHIYTGMAPYNKDYHTINSQVRRFFGVERRYEDYSYTTSVIYQPKPATYGLDTEATIILRPESAFETISYSEQKIRFLDTLSSIGGFLGLAGTTIIFLFGMSPNSPWGIIAQPVRRKVWRSLNASELTAGGIPLPFTVQDNGDADWDIGEAKRTSYLKRRVDNMERVLRDYYVDAEFFVFQREPQGLPQGPPQGPLQDTIEGSEMSQNTSVSTEANEDTIRCKQFKMKAIKSDPFQHADTVV
ncbi:hypothetical protein BGZ89_003608 [Linnemannia elongata]|nr:hypothetical protein BGZ89_003608 [Linnemannia elongata]